MAKKEAKVNLVYSKNLLVIIGILVLALIVIVLVLNFLNKSKSNNNSDNLNAECKIDSDCVRQSTDCCGCAMGGEAKCMSKQNASLINEKLKSCGRQICIAMYNCPETACGCVNGKCGER